MNNPSRNYDAILFDVDGTLLDSFAVYQTIMRQILPKFGKAASISILRQTFAMSVSQAIQQFGISEYERSELERDYDKVMASGQLKELPFKGVIKLLAQLHQRSIKLGVVTSRSRRDTMVLTKLPLPTMNVIVTADEVNHPKPHPESLCRALEFLKIAPDQGLYIGDDISDIQAAQAAGVDFAFANWSGRGGEWVYQAKYRFDEPGDVLKVIKK